jgi:hypothetical protein
MTPEVETKLPTGCRKFSILRMGLEGSGELLRITNLSLLGMYDMINPAEGKPTGGGTDLHAVYHTLSIYT